MDRKRFDALTRLLATRETRRAALGAALGAALFGAGMETGAKRRQRKRRAAREQRRNQTNAEQSARSCCRGGSCRPGARRNLARCCFEGADLAGKSFRASNLARANFTGANLAGAKFQSANLGDACLVDADVTGARFRGANLRGAIFCRTRTSEGIDNSGCGDGTRCCPTCVAIGASGCNLGGECCGGGECSGDGDGVCVCESECCSNDQCSSGSLCLGGGCFRECPGPTSCNAGGGGCESPAACRETTSGELVCITSNTLASSCATDEECAERLGEPAVCVLNEPGGCGPRGETHCAT